MTFFTSEDVSKLQRVLHVMKQSGCEIPEWMQKLRFARGSKRKQKTRFKIQINDPRRFFEMHFISKNEFCNHEGFRKKRRICKSADVAIAIAELTGEQAHVLSLILNEKLNVLITGPAGTGKSKLLQTLRIAVPDNLRCVFCAATASAAEVLGDGAVTFHAVFGLRPELCQASTATELFASCAALTRGCRRDELKTLDLLVVDEISMISSQILDKADFIARYARNNLNRSFGGLQIVFVGDFCQLPPVTGGWAFESTAWKECLDAVAVLQRPLRQMADSKFYKVLCELRAGKNDSIEWLNKFCLISNTKRKELKSFWKGIGNVEWPLEWSFLALRNDQVQEHNRACLKMHCTIKHKEPFNFLMTGGSGAPSYVARNLMLAEGVPVIICGGGLSTDGRRIVANRRGIVTRIQQLKVADKDAWVESQSLQSDGSYQDMRKFMDINKWIIPVVCFEGEQREMALLPYNFKDSFQVPLLCSWGLTIHRAQGLTLDKVLIVFESAKVGEIYVGLSRVKSEQDLQLLRPLNKVPTAAAVVDYYEGLGLRASLL